MNGKGKGEKPKKLLRFPAKTHDDDDIRKMGDDVLAEIPDMDDMLRQRAVGNLTKALEKFGQNHYNIRLDAITISLLHNAVSLAMTIAGQQKNDALVQACGEFRNAVNNLWLHMGLSVEDCDILNAGIVMLQIE